jgi:hypothetical protein
VAGRLGDPGFTGFRPARRRALSALLVSAGTHAVIDRRWPVRALMRAVGSPGFATVDWGVIAVDQALHLSILAMLAVLLGCARSGVQMAMWRSTKSV